MRDGMGLGVDVFGLFLEQILAALKPGPAFANFRSFVWFLTKKDQKSMG